MQSVTEGYFDFQALRDWVQQAASRWPDWVRLSSLGNSYEGRPLWCLTVTDWRTGHDRERSALWVDGNLHASELSGSNACLHLVQHLVEEQQELLGRVAFYVVPRVCPDGAELTLAGQPQFLRSSVRPYPYTDPVGCGIQPADINGDGKVLFMRVADPLGPWKACPEDPRLLTRRDPGDRQGPFYRLLPEGHWVGPYDGLTMQSAPKKQTLDLNRNFPIRWRPEHEQAGAGNFPASEPEVRHCVQFLVDHPNVCQAVTFHTFSGVILRPSSLDPDDALDPKDLATYKFFGERGSLWSGYPLLSVYHDFRYHPKEVITGTFDDWIYDALGAYAWTVEIWSVLRQAGITSGLDCNTPRGEHRFIRWFEQHPIEEELQLLRWCDEQLQGQGFVDWQPFAHPTLGEVEIGGWDMFYLFRNPPLQFLKAELEPLTRWVTWLAQANPQLQLFQESVECIGPDLFALQLVIDNAGWLPTYGSQKALQRKVVRGVRVQLELGDPCQLVQGHLEQELGQLEGIASRPSSPLWHKGDSSDQRLKVNWVVRASAGCRVKWHARHERAGSLRGEFHCL